MNVHVDLCLIPMGGDVSVSAEIAACQQIFQRAGLSHQLHAFGTNIEGEWDEVMAAVKACHEHVHQLGRVRVTSTLKIGTRTDREQSLGDKVDSVISRL
ncbi:MAG: MTH1187 family thiamine-binding protein [Gammaproteobacteria bacterium]|nr:MTH1187 family thiamine-binding protein [Gammaproteobacteria bacterium]MBQ0840985.1 MTH1187 family thiamine-binding protein [Gammaproteobacteria bacterium]